MRRVAALTLLVTVVIAGACMPRSEDAGMSEQASADIRRAVEEANASAAAAMSSGNMAGWLESYTDDAVLMWPNAATTRGRAANEAAANAMLAEGMISNVSFTTDEFHAFGDHALEIGTYRMTFTPTGGQGMEDTGKYMTLWQRQADGSWKITRDIFNSDMPAAGGG